MKWLKYIPERLFLVVFSPRPTSVLGCPLILYVIFNRYSWLPFAAER